jgi:hypothetical protein
MSAPLQEAVQQEAVVEMKMASAQVHDFISLKELLWISWVIFTLETPEII